VPETVVLDLKFVELETFSDVNCFWGVAMGRGSGAWTPSRDRSGLSDSHKSNCEVLC